MLLTRLRHFWICKKKKPRSTGQTCRSTTERLWFTVVVAGADLRHSVLLWSMSLSNRKAFGTLTQTNGNYVRTPRCFLRISLRIHHNFKPFRNCCYVSQHYSSHLRLTRQQDWTTSLDGYNRKWHSPERNIFQPTVNIRESKCHYLLYWSNRHGDQPHSCMPGYTFRLPADAKE